MPQLDGSGYGDGNGWSGNGSGHGDGYDDGYGDGYGHGDGTSVVSPWEGVLLHIAVLPEREKWVTKPMRRRS